MRQPLVAALLVSVQAKLLLDEDFSCGEIGCNASHGITNYSYWRWSTTGSAQTWMNIGPAAAPRTGNEVDFSVKWCPPPNPNPTHLGCYRSELALQRKVQATMIDWKKGVGSSERWFGFSNRLLNFTFDDNTPLNGPSFQLHGAKPVGSGSGHPNLNLQVDSTGCALNNRSCPVWTLEVSNNIDAPSPRCAENYPRCWVLGPALGTNGRFDNWNDWVIQWRGSPQTALGYVAIWRNGEVVLPLQNNIVTTYDDSIAPYLKFGVYRGSWKGAAVPTAGNATSIAYAALKVGDETSSFAEVSTATKLDL
jgi:hypothetical protein